MAVKNSKKRPAPSEAGSVAKKPHLSKTGKDRSAPKKRSVPVTQTPKTAENDGNQDESGSASEDGEDDEDILEAEEGDIEIDATNWTGKNDGNGNNGSKESHKAQKILQNERRAAKAHSATIIEAKKLWNLARQKNIQGDQRQKHIRALMAVVRGKVQEVVFKHDASRIVQTIVKYGGQEEREEIATELKGRYKDLSESKYSKFLVTKLVRHCPKHRTSILQEFSGHVIRLLLHREATSVIADAFELHATAFERALLVRDFYGREVALFTSTNVKKGGSIDDGEKETIRKGLKGVLTGADEGRRKRILTATKENLDLIFNNSDKGAVAHAIVHRALLEYLLELSNSPDDEKRRREVFESCQDLLADMIHTKDGSRAVREFIAQGTAKDRKQIIKVLKPHIERICLDDEAQLVLFTALDVIDDTKMTAKSLVIEIVSRAPMLYKNSQGRRSLLYLFVPRVSRHFTPAQVASIAETDRIRDLTSKKAVEVRRDEIRKAASEPMLSLLAEQGRAEEMLRDTGGSLVVTEVMLYANTDKSAASTAVLQPLAAPYPSSDQSKPHLIDVAHGSRVYKTLLQGGHYSHRSKRVDSSPSFSPSSFASTWIGVVGEESTVAMAQSGGTFVVAALCERVKEEGTEEEKKQLRQWFGTDATMDIQNSAGRGKDVLLASLSAI